MVTLVFSFDTKQIKRSLCHFYLDATEAAVISLSLDYMMQYLFRVIMLLKPFGSLAAKTENSFA